MESQVIEALRQSRLSRMSHFAGALFLLTRNAFSGAASVVLHISFLSGMAGLCKRFEVGPRIVVGPEARWAYATAVCLTAFPRDRKTLSSRSEGIGSFGLVRVPTTRRHAR